MTSLRNARDVDKLTVQKQWYLLAYLLKRLRIACLLAWLMLAANAEIGPKTAVFAVIVSYSMYAATVHFFLADGDLQQRE